MDGQIEGKLQCSLGHSCNKGCTTATSKESRMDSCAEGFRILNTIHINAIKRSGIKCMFVSDEQVKSLKVQS